MTRISSQQQQQSAFYMGGQAPNQQQPPTQNYAQAPPSTNGTSLVQNPPQQMAFQQNAALPGIDMSALHGINISAEQLMQIAHLLQSGQLTLPPPAPAANPRPSALPIPAPLPASAAPPQIAAPSPAPGHDVNMDREEGELEDDEEDASNAHAHATPSMGHSQSMIDRSVPPQGSRDNISPAAPSWSAPVPSASSPAGTSMSIQPAKAAEVPKPSTMEPVTVAPQPSLAVKAFVLELHRNGYLFEDLASEVGDTPALRTLYQQIGLPVPPKSGPSMKTPQQNGARNASASATSAQKPDAQRKASGTLSTAVKPGSTTAAAAKPDRASYLAKLQAAKNKKSEPAGESPTNHVQSPATLAAPSTPSLLSAVSTKVPQTATAAQSSALQAAGASATQPTATAAADSPTRPAPAKAVVKTELVRQRLAKLQAERAAALSAQRQSDGTALPSIGNVDSRQAQPNATLPPALPTSAHPAPTPDTQNAPHGFSPRSSANASPSVARGSGLPGLFTTRTPAQQSSSPIRPPTEASVHAQVPMQLQNIATNAVQAFNASPANSPGVLNPPRQRPMQGQQTSWNASSAPKRPFGDSGLQNGAFIIETSSDEDDDGEDMDTDDSTGQQSPEAEADQLPARTLGLLPDFAASKFDPKQGSSTPGTPAGELKRKLEELEVMKRELEEMKRRKVSVKPAASTQNAPMQSSSAALSARSSMPTTDAATPSAAMGTQSPSAAAYLSKQQEKEALRKRLEELESSLGRNLTSSSVATLPTSEANMQVATKQPEEQENDAVDGDGDDDGDDGDLYDLPPAHEETPSAPAANVGTQDSDDDDGEIYEPEAFNPAGDTDMTLQVSSDHGQIGSQATNDIANPSADAADSQLAAEIDAATADEAETEPGLDTSNVLGPSSFQQQGSEVIPVDMDHSKVGNGIEDGEVEDDDSEDMYEPTITHPSQQATITDPVSQSEIEQVEDDQDDDNEAMDISSDSSDSDSSSDESSDDYEPEQNMASVSSDLPHSSGPAHVRPEEAMAALEPEPALPAADDGLAPELQPAEEQHVAVAQPTPDSGFYKPYTSELSRFKQFRYHPDFIENVPGGHKSLTYSNNIDLNNPICRYEINGQCNDKDCEFQHFKTSE